MNESAIAAPRDDRRAGARAYATLAGLLFLHVLAHVDRNMLIAFSSRITADLGLDNVQYGFLVGAVWVLSFGVMATFAGGLADRFSRPRVIACGLVIWSACTAASGIAGSFAQLGLARFLVASGEASLVPAAVAILADVFPAARRGWAMGLFFTGIPLGIGCSFLLAGSVGQVLGWRGTFLLLGACGLACSVPLWFLGRARAPRAGLAANDATAERGVQFMRQVAEVARHMGRQRALACVMGGFVLAHLAFAALSFTQLWLVRDRGIDAAVAARTIGVLQLGFGLLGAIAGGFLSDRLSGRLPGGQATLMAGLVLLCVPLSMAGRWPGMPPALMHAGLCATAFLPMALYGPATALVQALCPPRLRASITGVQMMLINVFAIALGNLAVGAVSEALRRAGHAGSLTWTLLLADAGVLLAAPLFLAAARTSGHAHPTHPVPDTTPILH